MSSNAGIPNTFSDTLANSRNDYRAFSPTWPTSMQMYWNKRKRLHKKSIQFPQDWFGTPTWTKFHCFEHQYMAAVTSFENPSSIGEKSKSEHDNLERYYGI